MSAQEEWRPVPGYADYEVSDLGRVASLKGREPRILRPYLVDGYPTVTLRGDGVRRLRKVHHLVAESFIGPRPEGMEVCHSDGDRLNNVVRNLRYGTRSDNMQDRLAHGRHPMANKTHCKRGHEFNEANTHVYRGARFCRPCRAARQASSSELAA